MGKPFFKVDAVIRGDTTTHADLAQLKDSARRRILRLAMAAAVRPVAKEAKRLAPRDSGLLRKSIGSKSKTYPSGVTVGVVGPRHGFRQTVPRSMWPVEGNASRLVRKVRMVMADPVKYVHLVEFDTQPHTLGGGNVVGKSQTGATHPGTTAVAFMSRALNNKQSEATNILAQKTREGITREALKLGKRKSGK